MTTWPEGWVEPDVSEAEALRRRLHGEVGEGHVLWCKTAGCHVLARNYFDDILVRLDGQSVAMIHLTYSSRRERPPWPWTSLYSSLDQWLMAATEMERLRRSDSD